MSDFFGSENASPESTSFVDSVRNLLTENETSPGFMYQNYSLNEPTVPGTPAESHQGGPAAHDPQSQQLLQALQYEKAQNEHLAERARYLASIEEFLSKDPVSANRAIQYLNTGTLGDESTVPPTAQDELPAAVRKQLADLQSEVRYISLKNQSAELERDYPGIYQAAPVAQYMAKHGFSNLKDAFHHLLGNSMGEIIRGQQVQQYQQQMRAWQQYQQQYQQQYTTSSQQPQTHSQAQHPVPYTTPPPAANDPAAVVLRPGAGLMAPDPMDNVKAKSWNEIGALVSHDMKRAGFQL